MKRWAWVLFLLVSPMAAMAQAKPPESMTMCFTPAAGEDWWNQCIAIGDLFGERVGSLGIGYIKWHVDIDAWSIDHIKLTATAKHPDANGKTEELVIEGRPDILRDGIARVKVRYVGAHATKSKKAVITWQPPTPKLTGLFIN